MATRFENIDDVLYPPLEPSKTGMLQVSDLHTVYWEESGNATGLPVIVLHGGPGGGSQAVYRQYFDPTKYRIVMMDQRGCGKSTPHAELEDNNTQAKIISTYGFWLFRARQIKLQEEEFLKSTFSSFLYLFIKMPQHIGSALQISTSGPEELGDIAPKLI